MKIQLVDVNTRKDKYSNIVFMTFTFRVKAVFRDFRLINTIVSNRISEMIDFDFEFLENCSWADGKCKTVEKSIIFFTSEKVKYHSTKEVEQDKPMNQIAITPYNTPWEIACVLINAKYEKEHFLTKEKYMGNFFDIDDLKRIGEHLINYCNTEKGGADG